LKRFFDILLSGIGVTVLAPAFILVAVILKFVSPGPVFFRQERMGLKGSTFRIFKIRTMKVQKLGSGCQVTAGGDSRIFPFGRFLRRTKLDEFPQLINVLQGDMSLVGPRPEVAEFANLFPSEFQRILKVRPGITHPATLRFRREEEILAKSTDPREFYINRVMPKKLAAYEEDLQQSLLQDIQTIVRTIIPNGTIEPYGPEHFVPAEACTIIPFPATTVENIPVFEEVAESADTKATGISDFSSRAMLN